MAIVSDLAVTMGASLKATVRLCRANAITVVDAYTLNLSGPQTTTITNALLADKTARPSAKRDHNH